jgi:DNA-binding IclR family transcriptional regulator
MTGTADSCAGSDLHVDSRIRMAENARAKTTDQRTGTRIATRRGAPRRAAAQVSGNGSPQLLERTFAVLSLFASEQREWTTTEIGTRCNLPVPTAHRIVLALQRHGLLVRDPVTKRFRLGPMAIDLGRAALSANDLPSIAANVLPQLTAETEETSLLTVLSEARDSSVCLMRVESPHPLRLAVAPGRSLPLHAGASQKILLAYLPEAQRKQIGKQPLTKFCDATLSRASDLHAELARIRETGWSYSFQETNIGVWGVAVALLDGPENPVAAIGVAGPEVRLTKSMLGRSLAATKRAADKIAAALGLQVSLAEMPDDPLLHIPGRTPHPSRS